MVDLGGLTACEESDRGRREEPAEAAAASSERHDIKPAFVVLFPMWTNQRCANTMFDGRKNFRVVGARVETAFHRRKMAYRDPLAIVGHICPFVIRQPRELYSGIERRLRCGPGKCRRWH